MVNIPFPKNEEQAKKIEITNSRYENSQIRDFENSIVNCPIRVFIII